MSGQVLIEQAQPGSELSKGNAKRLHTAKSSRASKKLERPPTCLGIGAGRLDHRLTAGCFLSRLVRHLFGEMTGRQLTAAHIPKRRFDSGALLRIAQLLPQPAPCMEAAA